MFMKGSNMTIDRYLLEELIFMMGGNMNIDRYETLLGDHRLDTHSNQHTRHNQAN